MNRRRVLKIALLGTAALAMRPKVALAFDEAGIEARLAALERDHGGRLGVAIHDPEHGRVASYRGDERFLMCSTFKVVAVAAVLSRVDRRAERLERRIVFSQKDVLAYAPITSKHVGGDGMTVAELCEAAITVSDNTAANLLLTSLGGPAAVTSFARSLNDQLTRLDRIEPELNVSAPGDVRDTTTPTAMLADLQKILLGRTLSDASRGQLIEWLCACTTGQAKIRAGVPAGWKVGDKTGNSGRGESNDVAIIWSPGRQPVLVTAYYVNATADDTIRNGVLAEVGRIVTEGLSRPTSRT